MANDVHKIKLLLLWEIEDKELDLEAKYIEEETQKEEKEKLYEAISKLTVRQQEFVRLIFFEGIR